MTQATMRQAPVTCWRPLQSWPDERAGISSAHETPVEPIARSPRTGRLQGGEIMLLELQRYIKLGYWRVAIRRFLMMQAQGLSIPCSETQRCAEFIRRCSEDELAAIYRRVAEWTQIVGLSDKGSSTSVPALGPGTAAAATYRLHDVSR